jgi:hypothetical protein
VFQYGCIRRVENKIVLTDSANPEQVLQVIKKCEEFRSTPTAGPQRWKIMQKQREGCRELHPIYEWYINRLSKEVKIIESIDPESLGLTYKEWEVSKDLQVVHELTRYTNPPNEAWIPIPGEGVRSNQWNTFIGSVKKSCGELMKDENIILLKAAYWKWSFIEGQNKAVWIKNIIDKKIEKAKAEERRKQELAIDEERRKEDEERRKVEAEIAERKRIDEENRLKSYGVTAKVPSYELCSNPFRYEDKTVVIVVMFKRMMERTTGVFFYPGSDCEILVSKLPSNLFTMTGQTAKLTVKVRGTTEVVNSLGMRFKVPYVEYIAF